MNTTTNTTTTNTPTQPPIHHPNQPMHPFSERWVLASEVQKLSVPELQAIQVLRRKSNKELYRMSMSTELLLQCTYARYAVTALVRGCRPMTDPLFGTTEEECTAEGTEGVTEGTAGTLPSKGGETKNSGGQDNHSHHHHHRTVLAFCRYLRMLSTHECSLSSKRKLMGWLERFESCGR